MYGDKVLALRKKIKLEYDAKKKQLESELKEKLDAIDIVANLLGSELSSEVAKPPKRLRRRKPKQVNVSDIVRGAINNLEGEFSINDIKEKVSEVNSSVKVSRNVLHNVLKKKKDLGQIKVVKVGKGRNPTIYRKIEKEKATSHELVEE